MNPACNPSAKCRTGKILPTQQQFGITGQGDGDIQPSLLPAGELDHPAGPLVLQADQLDHLPDRPRMGEEVGEHADHLLDSEIGVDRARLQHDPEEVV